MPSGVGVAVAALTLVIGWSPRLVEARAPAPPWTLSLSASAIRPGEEIYIGLTPRLGAGDPGRATLLDVYITVGKADSDPQFLKFLTASGSLSPTPSPFLSGHSVASLPSLTSLRLLPDRAMAGQRFKVGVRFVQPGRSAFVPANWVYDVLTAEFRVARHVPVLKREWALAAALVIATVGAVMLVLRA